MAKGKKEVPELNSSSTADISFLLFVQHIIHYYTAVVKTK